MKHIYYLCALVILATAFSSCLEDECSAIRTFKVWNPIYIQPEDFRIELTTDPGKELKTPGKIYFYDNYIFVNELRKGVHIIDNQNPENPQNVAFINIPGNVDMAVKDNVLYTDSYVDLLSIDISNPLNPTLLERCENIFPLQGFVEGLGILSHFEETQETLDIDCDDPNVGQQWWWFNDSRGFAAEASFDASAVNRAGGAAVSSGVGGSLARFTIASGYLYSVSNFDLKVFDLSNANKPRLITETNVGWGIETIFPSGENLFLGANDGMYIFDNSNPERPSLLSKFEHARACDPVYVVGDIAYVTLRDGTTCENFNNQLDVVDVSDLRRPELLATHAMHNPHGLSIADDHIFICENDEGLKVFDASDIETIGESLTEHVKGFTTYDIITLPNKVALVIGADGLYQFDYSEPSDLKQLSVISVE